MNKIYLLLAWLLFAQAPMFAQGWIKTYYDYSSNWLNNASQKTLDNGFIMSGHIGIFSYDVHVTKTDAFGNIQWTRTLVKPDHQYVIAINQIPSDGSYLILYQDVFFDGYLLRLDPLGQIISDTPINVGMNIWTGAANTNTTITSDEKLLITSCGTDTANHNTIGLAKLDLSGNVSWSRIYHVPNYQSYSMDVLETTDGNYIMAGHIDTAYYGNNNGNGSEMHVIKTDTAGNDLWRKTYKITNSDRAESIINTSDGGYLVTGFNNVGSNAKFLVMKLDANGNKLWHWVPSVPGGAYDGAYAALENADGTYTATGYWTSSVPPYYHGIGLVKLNSAGNVIWAKHLATGQNVPHGEQIYTNSNGGYAIVGTDASGMFILTADSMGVCYSNHLVGKYFYDLNGNCVQDMGEGTLSHRLVNVTKGSEHRYGLTDVTGRYIVEVDTGTYTVEAEQISPYWQFCQNPQTVTFSNFYSQDTVDIAVQVLDTCTYMEVDVSAPFLRRCFPATYYVNYANWGTKDAQNAYVELTLDPYLTFDSSSVPLASQTGNLYRFDLGTVNMTTSGTFVVYVTVDCDSTVLGQVHCVDAHIYPDTICIPNYWNGPIIQANSTCNNDSISFMIQNLGSNMLSPQNYTIIEEHVMIHAAPFQLGSGMNQIVKIPALPGAAYRMEVAQAPNYPILLGDSIAISNVVGCNTPPVLNFPGILNQFYNGNSSPFISTDCQPNIGAFDPNDKQAQPLGYGMPHYIENNIPINYKIRFQNTGTDTAFTVVVVDTLDAALEPSSIKMGASSHPYTWELRENGILVVTFNNILLPDSNVNLLGSNGFFKFEIQQQPNNAVGTVIHNQAGIYFDFNPPVMTNQTFHTIGQDFITVILVGTEDVLQENLHIKVYPNPFEQMTTLEIEGAEFQNLNLEIFNATGQLVKTVQNSHSNVIQLDRGNLATGIYMYRLMGDNELLNTGKLMVR